MLWPSHLSVLWPFLLYRQLWGNHECGEEIFSGMFGIALNPIIFAAGPITLWRILRKN